MLSSLFLLCISSIAQAALSLVQAPIQNSKDRNVDLNFDDISTTKGLGNLSFYHHLNFSSFTTINTPVAFKKGLIEAVDLNCASSAPNALIASRAKTPSLWPRIVLSNSTAKEVGISPYFNLIGLAMKPLNQTKAGMCISLAAYGIDDEKEVHSQYSLVACYGRNIDGPHEPINITDIFPGWGRDVNMVEMYAQRLEGEEWVDQGFCIDDLLIEYQKPGEENLRPWSLLRPPILPLMPSKGWTRKPDVLYATLSGRDGETKYLAHVLPS